MNISTNRATQKHTYIHKNIQPYRHSNTPIYIYREIHVLKQTYKNTPKKTNSNKANCIQKPIQKNTNLHTKLGTQIYLHIFRYKCTLIQKQEETIADAYITETQRNTDGEA